MGLGDGAYNLIANPNPVIKWPASFWILFWHTLIFAAVIGVMLAPIMIWVGSRLPKPKLNYLLTIGFIAGPVPFLLMEGICNSNFTGVLVFSLLGGFSAVLWWYLVEKHRVVLEI